MLKIRGIMHLTYPDFDPNILSASSAEYGEAGAPANEIEITPEMIAAGAEVLYAFETETTDETYWAIKVYVAMRNAAPHLAG